MGLGLRNKYHALRNEIGIRVANATARPNKNISAVYFHPSDMCEPDRIMLYAIIRGMRPERVLEIGARWGGSARIISAALEDSGFGAAIGIDPEPQAFRPSQADLFNRYTLMTGYSPQAIPAAVAKLGGKIDFAFIDAMHTHDHVLADFTGIIPHMSAGGHVILHDTFHVGINQAIEEVLAANPTFTDCGFLTRYPDAGGAPVAYQGLRLIRTGELDARGIIKTAFPQADFSPELFNWDAYWNRVNAHPSG